MPGHPHVAPSVAAVKGSVYTALAHRLANHQGEVYPLHIGDTWMEPAEGCRMEDLTVAEHPGMHRYAPVTGLPTLVDAIVERTRLRTGVSTERGNVLVSAGATGALGAVGGAIVAPGDEVLILAPFWPLIAGIVRSFHGTPVPVPFIGTVDGPESAVEAVEAARTERTVALYLNTPNNPTGRVIPQSWISALVEWAREHGLWLISDEVYEDYQYVGEHTYVRALAPERTFSAYSFSKGFGMSGNRCGYVVGPEAVMPALAKVSTHTFYSTPTASQLAAARVLDGPGDAWVANAHARYAELGRMAAARLGVPEPEGSTFLFVDVAEHLDEQGVAGFLEKCVDRGLFMAPGSSFGDYPTHVRMCFTSASPDVVARGVEVFASLVGR
ncbi:MAG: pyridoxal phosphate-dependent aminotransferase [Deltaproteobacteria bacterium]|nr:MAG: pyridoxal phosphate-dependent aminotransferase [Deltaproteobacteria bacterium]